MFVAILPYHRRLILTRYGEGYAVFRILNEDLEKLESGTERLVAQVSAKTGSLSGLAIVDNEVEIDERGHDRIVMRGSVINRPLKEAVRRHPATALSVLIAGIAALISILLIAFRAWKSIV